MIKVIVIVADERYQQRVDFDLVDIYENTPAGLFERAGFDISDRQVCFNGMALNKEDMTRSLSSFNETPVSYLTAVARVNEHTRRFLNEYFDQGDLP